MQAVNEQCSNLLDQLRKQICGAVVALGDKEYDTQRTPWLQVVDQHPTAIVNAVSIEDICACVRIAVQRRLPLAVQNTGHGIARVCDGGILLRLSNMKTVSVNENAQTATVEPGVTSGELLAVTEPHGLAYASGQVSNVGVIGYTLGGGYGWIGRKVGAACYAIQSAIVVLADGSVVTANESEHSELFWAIKGGGGNFGVVASLTVGLVRLEKIFGDTAYYRFEDAAEVLSFYREWTAELGDDTSTILRLMQLPPKPLFLQHGLTKTCAIGVCHTDPTTAEALHRRITDFKKPVLDQLETRPLSEMASFDEASDLAASPTYGQVEHVREMTDEVLESFVSVAEQKIPPLMQFELQHLGGKLIEQRGEAAAYTAPQAPFLLHLVSPAINTTLGELALVTKEAFDAFGPVYTGEVSYNFLRGDQQERVPAAFGEAKYKRLQRIKCQYDPENIFHFNLNIPPLG